MRTDLYRHPKVILMSEMLADVNGPLSRFVKLNLRRDMTVTSSVMRSVTVGALVSVWGVARHRGDRLGDDLVLEADKNVVDLISDIPGLGAAMEACGWLVVRDKSIVFPRFFKKHNVDPGDDHKEKNRERQRKFRASKRNVTDEKRNVTVTLENNARVEESRGEERVTTTVVTGVKKTRLRGASSVPDSPDPEVSEPKGRPSSPSSKVRGSAALGDLLRHAMAGPIAGRETVPVLMKLSRAIREIREENGKHPWPENPSDRSDLKQAVKRAIRAGAIPLLIECLEDAAGWANNGAGFRDAMSKAGLL